MAEKVKEIYIEKDGYESGRFNITSDLTAYEINTVKGVLYVFTAAHMGDVISVTIDPRYNTDEVLAEITELAQNRQPQNEGGQTETQWEIERKAIAAQLRIACDDFGDNDWGENLHLVDVIDKHLVRHLWAGKEGAAVIDEQHARIIFDMASSCHSEDLGAGESLIEMLAAQFPELAKEYDWSVQKEKENESR